MATYKVKHNDQWIYTSGIPGRTTSGPHVYSHDGSTQGEIGIDSTVTENSSNVITSGAVANETKAIEAENASEFSSANAYAIGNYCTKNNKLYKFTSAHVAGTEWNISEVSETTIGAQLSEQSEQIVTLQQCGFTVVNGELNITYEEA